MLILLEVYTLAYIARCLQSKLRPLNLVLEVIIKDTNFRNSDLLQNAYISNA